MMSDQFGNLESYVTPEIIINQTKRLYKINVNMLHICHQNGDLLVWMFRLIPLPKMYLNPPPSFTQHEEPGHKLSTLRDQTKLNQTPPQNITLTFYMCPETTWASVINQSRYQASFLYRVVMCCNLVLSSDTLYKICFSTKNNWLFVAFHLPVRPAESNF